MNAKLPWPLPLSAGTYAVGSIRCKLTDSGRPAHLMSKDSGRHLSLKVWYPAMENQSVAPELLWSELREDPQSPLLARALLGLLRHRTHSQAGARFAAGASLSELVLYNHGFISFASENTSLMETLASRGYTVIAVRHLEQLAEFRALQRTDSGAHRQSMRALEQRILRADPRERASLAHDYYEASSNTGRIVRERAVDSSFALDHLTAVLANIPGRAADRESASAVHLVGFSAGGAVATQIGLCDPRARSVTNLDGGTQGTVDARSLRVPYLMLYSARNEGINDQLLPEHARRLSLPDTAHLNYHDMAGVLPILRATGALGSTNARECLRQRNEIVGDFVRAAGG